MPDPTACRHSLFERIAWTYDLDPVDRAVLGALATFGNYRTGAGCWPSLEKLGKRVRLLRRTLLRSLERLEADGYVVGVRRHKQPTVYDIACHRLAIDMNGTVLSVTADTQAAAISETLSVTGDTQDPPMRVTADTQDPVLSVTGGTRSFVRTDPPIELDPPISTSAAADLPTGPDPRHAAQGRLAGLLREVLAPDTQRQAHARKTARQVAKVLRSLFTRRRAVPWPDLYALKHDLARELKALKIATTPADRDDALSWVTSNTELWAALVQPDDGERHRMEA